MKTPALVVLASHYANLDRQQQPDPEHLHSPHEGAVRALLDAANRPDIVRELSAQVAAYEAKVRR